MSTATMSQEFDFDKLMRDVEEAKILRRYQSLPGTVISTSAEMDGKLPAPAPESTIHERMRDWKQK